MDYIDKRDDVEQCGVDENNIYWRDGKGRLTHIANFTFKLDKVAEVESQFKYHVRFFASISDSVQEVHSSFYSFEEFSELDFFAIDRHLVLAMGNRSRKCLCHFFQQQASLLEDSDLIYVSKLGEFCVAGVPYYAMGSEVLPIANNTKCIIDTSLQRRFKLDYDKTLSEKEAFAGMLRFFDINRRKTDIIMVDSVVGHIKSFLDASGVYTNYTLFIAGETQTKKTTTVQFATSIYNRAKGLKFNTVRTDTSLPYAEKMGEEFRDAVVVYDDIFKDSKRLNENDAHAQGIIREVADESARNTIRGGKEINAHFAMTSEIWLENISDLGRVWLVHFNTSVDEERLAVCQTQPLVISSFIRYFVSWLYSHYNLYSDEFQAEMSNYKRNRSKNKSRYRRLDNIEFTLTIVFDLILTYGCEINAISEEMCKSRMKNFREDLDKSKRVQQMVMEKLANEEQSKSINFAKALVYCIENKIFDFDERTEQYFVHTVHGIKCIYIRTEYLTDVLNVQFNQHNSPKFYTKYFANKNLLYRNSTSNVVKYDGLCYMAIRIDRLKLEACCDDYKIERLFR